MDRYELPKIAIGEKCSNQIVAYGVERTKAKQTHSKLVYRNLLPHFLFVAGSRLRKSPTFLMLLIKWNEFPKVEQKNFWMLSNRLYSLRSLKVCKKKTLLHLTLIFNSITKVAFPYSVEMRENCYGCKTRKARKYDKIIQSCPSINANFAVITVHRCDGTG